LNIIIVFTIIVTRIIPSIDRNSDLGYLEEQYKKPGFEPISITGWRRVGKTRLI